MRVYAARPVEGVVEWWRRQVWRNILGAILCAPGGWVKGSFVMFSQFS